MALAFTYRLTAQAPQGDAPPPHPASAGNPFAPTHGGGAPVVPWSPESDSSMQQPLAPAPDLLAQGAIGTMPADPSQRPDSGLGFSCLDLLAGFVESGP